MSTDDFFATAPAGEAQTDRYGRPLLNLGNGKLTPVTRASTLSKTLDYTGSLGDWNERVVAHGIAQRPDLTALASVTPVTDKKSYEDILTKAKIVGGGTAKADLGTAFHALMVIAASGGSTEGAPAQLVDAVNKVMSEFTRLGITILPELSEQTCVTQSIGATGTWDGIAVMPDGRKVILDYKTGRIDYLAHSTAIQTAIYAHADLIMTAHGDPVPMIDVAQEMSLLVHVDLESGQVGIYELDLVAGWQGAVLAAKVRAYRRKDDLMYPYTGYPAWQPAEPAVPAGVNAVVAPSVSTFDTTEKEWEAAPTAALSPQAQQIVSNIEEIKRGAVPTVAPTESVQEAPQVTGEPPIDPLTETEELFDHLRKSKPAAQIIAAHLMNKHGGSIKTTQYGIKICGEIVRHPAWPSLRKTIYDLEIHSNPKASELVHAALNADAPQAAYGPTTPESTVVAPRNQPADEDPFADIAPIMERVALTESDLLARIGEATSLADLSEIWKIATSDASIGWTGQLNTASTIRRKQLGL